MDCRSTPSDISIKDYWLGAELLHPEFDLADVSHHISRNHSNTGLAGEKGVGDTRKALSLSI